MKTDSSLLMNKNNVFAKYWTKKLQINGIFCTFAAKY